MLNQLEIFKRRNSFAMQMICYHSTIKAKLDEILKSGSMMPGMESPQDDAYIFEWMILGQYHHPSSQHIYLWRSFEEAADCAKFISQKSKNGYSVNEKAPIVVEINVIDDSKLSPDPHSKGVRYEGYIPKNFFLRTHQI
jgi:hypothetical protein